MPLSPHHSDIARSALNDVITQLVALGMDPSTMQFSTMREGMNIPPAVGTLTAARECLRLLESIEDETQRRNVARAVSQQLAQHIAGNTNHGV
jgi:hypothetical protein